MFTKPAFDAQGQALVRPLGLGGARPVSRRSIRWPSPFDAIVVFASPLDAAAAEVAQTRIVAPLSPARRAQLAREQALRDARHVPPPAWPSAPTVRPPDDAALQWGASTDGPAP